MELLSYSCVSGSAVGACVIVIVIMWRCGGVWLCCVCRMRVRVALSRAHACAHVARREGGGGIVGCGGAPGTTLHSIIIYVEDKILCFLNGAPLL